MIESAAGAQGCNADPAVMNITYPKLGAALNATGRPILYSCRSPHALLACARAQHACSTTKQHNSTARITQK